MDTRRCYLCGYLVCVECWSAEHMENACGRVAAIVVCKRCYANVQACEYAEVFAGTAEERAKHRGTARVVGDSDDTPTVALLIDFLSTSLLNATAGSSAHGAVVRVIRTLLRQEENDDDYSSDEYDDSGKDEYERTKPRFDVLEDEVALVKVGEMLSDEQRLPALEHCILGNAEKRDYTLDLPDDIADIPLVPIPKCETTRMETIESTGLTLLAQSIAPTNPAADIAELERNAPNVQDLELICHLVVKTLGCGYAFVTLITTEIEHILAATHPGFLHAAVPRSQSTCQHTIMSPHPFLAAHHEADVRFHNHGPVSDVPIRFYFGCPVMVPAGNGEMIPVGTLCCIDTKPRAEITRTQYATIKRLTSTAAQFMLQKAHRLQAEQKHLLKDNN